MSLKKEYKKEDKPMRKSKREKSKEEIKRLIEEYIEVADNEELKKLEGFIEGCIAIKKLGIDTLPS